MASVTITDATPGPVSIWSGGGINPFWYVDLSPVVQFAWDGIYGSIGDLTITLTSPDGRTSLGTMTDPNRLGYLAQDWVAASNTYTQRSNSGPHPDNNNLQSAGSLLHGLLYTAPNLAAGDTLTVQAKISFSSVLLDAVNQSPTPNTPLLMTVTDPNPIIVQVAGERPTSGPIPINVGPDNFTFNISEDAYMGDAQFVISIDGKEYGAVQTATASHRAGETQTFIVNGLFAPFSHSYAINFLNDAYGGSDTTDRNLYVDSISFNGIKAQNSGLSLFSGGQVVKTYTPVLVETTFIGTGPDTFKLTVSEDAYQGDAQFFITVDSKQQGDLQTVTALHAEGQHKFLEVRGDFADGLDHTVAITFVNDAWGGTTSTDRNLYVAEVSFNGSTTGVIPTSDVLFSNGSLSFLRPATGPDKLVVSLSEDAYQGDAQAEITLDGKVLGQVSVTALHSGTPQDFTFTGFFGTGSHVVGVNFLNDAWGGTDTTDRNLYVAGISCNGINHAEATASLFSAGIMTFAV